MNTTRPAISYTGKSQRKLAPVEYQAKISDYGTVLWQHRQETGDDVYKRDYRALRGDFESDMRDKFGVLFARKVVAELDAFGIVRHRLDQKIFREKRS